MERADMSEMDIYSSDADLGGSRLDHVGQFILNRRFTCALGFLTR